MTPVPPSLIRFGDQLHRAAWEELSTDTTPAPAHARPRLLRRPRIVAGGSLGLAGVAAALVVTLTAGGATAPPAFAVTRANDGSVFVHLTSLDLGAVRGAEHELASMGIDDYFDFKISMGAQDSTPVTCTSASGTSGPTVRVVLDDGAVPAGETGAGTWHLMACSLHPGTFPGVSSNTGGGATGTSRSGAGSTGTGNSGS